MGDSKVSRQYRCSIQAISNLLQDVSKSITAGHKELMRRTPFKHLFEALVDQKIDGKRTTDKVLDDLLGTFDKEKGKFKFGSKHYEPTRMDVKLILGIEDGNEDVGRNNKHAWDETEIGPRLFGQIKKIPSSLIKGRIRQAVVREDESGMQDTVKLLCLLLFQSFFFSNSGSCIAWAYVYYVDDFERLKSYDWSTHILGKLMESLKKEWTDPTQVNGCTLFLLYWFCEHTIKMRGNFKGYAEGAIISSKVDEEHLGINWIPRMKKWKMMEVESVIQKAKLGGQKAEMQFIHEELTPTEAEEDMIEALNDNNTTEQLLVVEDSDFEEPTAIVRRVVKKNSGTNADKYNWGGYDGLSEDKAKAITAHSAEDFGGPSFSLFQNESQDILNESHSDGIDGKCTKLMKQRDDELGNTNVKAAKEEEEQHEKVISKIHDDKSQEGVEVQIRRTGSEEQRGLIRVIDELVADLKERNQAQAIMIQKLETERNNADKVASMKVAQNVAYVQEINCLRLENKMLTKSIEAAMEKIEQNATNDKQKDEYMSRIQDSLDNVQIQLEVKKRENVESMNEIEEKSRVIKTYESKLARMEEVYSNMQCRIGEMTTMLNEQANTIATLKKIVDERDTEISERKQKIEILENVIAGIEDITIEEEVHQVTQMYYQRAPQDQKTEEPITMVNDDESSDEPTTKVEQNQGRDEARTMVERVKERKRGKRLKDEQFEYPLDKKSKDVVGDHNRDEGYIAIRGRNKPRR